MPYIKAERRQSLENTFWMADAGELNYLLTKTIQMYWRNKGHSYKVANDIIGALEGAKMEFYRRVVAPYEDQKIKENGDVY